MNTKKELEDGLAERFNREFCVLVGRGTTGLSLALNEADISGNVIFPTYTCAAAAYSTIYASVNPVFADVRADYTISPSSIRENITSETEAIVPIHLFGHPAQIDEIQSICKSYDLYLIEDACQSLGTEYNGEPTGSFGDISVVSFGHKKHIDAGGGGAVLTDDAELAERLQAAEREVPRRNEAYLKELFDYYRRIYYEIEELSERHANAQRLYEPFPDVFKELFYRGFEQKWVEPIADGIQNFDENAATRRQYADYYRKTLSHPRITHPTPRGDPVYFRYSVQLETKELRDHTVTYLRDRDIHVSTLYTPIHRRFGDSSVYPTAEDLADRTLNLWVAPRVDKNYVSNCASAVLSAIESFN